METYQIVLAVLGVTFGIAFPPHHFARFLICLTCYCGAIATMALL